MRRPIIMTVGSKGGPLEKLELELARTHVDVQHINLASNALELISSRIPDVIVAAFPPNDLSSEDFFDKLDKGMTWLTNTKVVLLADEHHLPQLEPHLDRRHLLLSPSWAPELLKRYVFSLLSTEKRSAKRLMLRLEVEMGTGSRLHMCQTDNISESGMLVRTNHLPLVGTKVRIVITLPAQTEPVAAKAEVVRHTDPDRETIRGLGLRFLEIEGQGLLAMREYLEMQDDWRSGSLGRQL